MLHCWFPPLFNQNFLAVYHVEPGLETRHALSRVHPFQRVYRLAFQSRLSGDGDALLDARGTLEADDHLRHVERGVGRPVVILDGHLVAVEGNLLYFHAVDSGLVAIVCHDGGAEQQQAASP